MYQLTKLDIAALKTADTIVARYNKINDVSRLEAVKDASDTNPWEQRHHIAVSTATTAYNSNHDGSSYDMEVYSACAIIRMYRYDTQPMDTLLALLKVGDSLTVQFTANNNTGYLNDAGLHRDTCAITIYRGAEGAKQTRLMFHITETICPDNSARMCRTSTRATHAYQLTS